MSAKEAPAPAPAITLNINDTVAIGSKSGPQGTIVESKIFKDKLHYSVSRMIGTKRQTSWHVAADLTLVEAAIPPAFGSPTGHDFKVGDKVRNIIDDKVRTVVEIVDGHRTLMVYKDEAAGKKSPFWAWAASRCTLVQAVDAEEAVEVTTAKCYGCDGPRPAGSYHCATCKAELEAVEAELEAEYEAELEAEAADIDLTDFETPAAPTGDVYDAGTPTWTPEAHPEGFVIDALPGADPADSIAVFITDHTDAEIKADYGIDLTLADILEDNAEVADKGEVEYPQHILKADLDAHIKRTYAAEARAAELERELMQLQNMIASKTPISNIVAPSTCVQYKTLNQPVFNSYIAEADRDLADAENEGWEIANISVVGLYSQDGNEGGSYAHRIVTLKRIVPTTAPTPQRPSAGAHASLTGDYVREQSIPRSMIKEVIELPTVNAPMNSLQQMVRTFRASGTNQMLDSQFDEAIERGRQRIAAMPIFNSELHTLKAGG